VRRDTVPLLRCPRCLRGGLSAGADSAELLFGPLSCVRCEARYPVSEGVADLSPDHPEPAGLLQRGFELPLVARGYERSIRPLAQAALALRRHDAQSEALVYRSLLGAPPGPVLDLGCGTGLLARKLSREPGFPPVIGMDLSRAMLEEALAQAREHGAAVDLLRAQAPALPFQDGALGAVLHVGGLHLFPSIDTLLREVHRVLAPGGRYVASTYLPPRLRAGQWLQASAGLYPRTEDTLQRALKAAGFRGFERLLLPPFILVKAVN